MQENDISLIKHKSLKGIVALTTRTFVLQLISLISTLLLTIFLSPSVFGIFFVVSAIIAFLGYFSDIGLAAALIQKKEDVTPEDLTTTFTIQQMLVLCISGIAFVLSPTIARFYNLDYQGLILLQTLIVAFFLSSLKTIPSVLLERRLEFQKLVIPQLLETLGFYVVAVTLAWLGFGIMSFSWAVIVRAVLGLFSIYIISPWKPNIGFSPDVAKRLTKFGIPFQINSLLALIKDDLFTVFLGKMLPFEQVGYIGWAKKWAEVPLRLIMDSVVRVTFPAFSRIQHDKKFLSKAIDTTLFGLSLTIFPITASLLFVIHPVVLTIPKYIKWEPALISFYLFAISSAIAALNSPLTNALNAIGKIKTTLGLMILWTCLTWILSIILILIYGFNGFALALVCISLTIVLVIYLIKQIIQLSFFESVGVPLYSVAVQLAWYGLGWIIQIHDLPIAIVWTVLGVGIYVTTAYIMSKTRLEELVGYFITSYGRS